MDNGIRQPAPDGRSDLPRRPDLQHRPDALLGRDAGHRGNAYFFATYDVTREGLIRVFTGDPDVQRALGFHLVRRQDGAAASSWRGSRRRSAGRRSPRACGSRSTSASSSARHSERRIRIIDMIGRRGRFITLGGGRLLLSLLEHCRAIRRRSSRPRSCRSNLFDAVVASWIFLAFYYSDGFLAAAFYGAQSRVMDGVLARANCLLITTLWTVFKFVMVPLGARLAAIYRPAEFAVVFALIWGSYMITDAAAEIGGVALRQADAPRLGHRRRQSQVDRRHGVGVRRVLSSSASGSSSAAACRCPGSAWRWSSPCRTRCWSCSRRAGPTTSRWRPRTR